MVVPAVRALADRFMYDTATVKHIANNLSEEMADRVTPGAGWTVRQVLAHLALNQKRYASVVEHWLREPLAADPGGDPTEENERMAVENAVTPLDEIVATFDSSIRELVAACDGVTEKHLASPLGLWQFVEVLASWSRHQGNHAVDLVSALPEFKTDPMVLNWVLHFDYSNQPEWSDWQLKLIAEVREIFNLQGEEEA
jgi:uncharacterized protein (TIGR03083 family)